MMLAAPVCGLAAALDVAARSSVEADADSIGAELRVRGTVRDDLGRPVPFRNLRLSGRSEAAPPIDTWIRSDGSGRFEWRRVVRPGSWTVEVTFPGDPYTDASGATGRVAVVPAPAALRVSGPTVVPAGTDRVRLLAGVQVGDLPADRVPIALESSCGEPLDAMTDGEGEAELTLALGVSEATVCELRLTAVGEGRFESTSARHVIRVVRRPTLALEAVFVARGPFDEGAWQVTAAAWDDLGPIPGATLRIQLSDGTPLVEGDSAGDGRVLERIAASEVPSGAGIAVALVVDGGVVAVSDALVPGTPTRFADVFGPAALAASALAVVALLFALFRERRGAKPPPRERTLPAVETAVDARAGERSDGAWVVEVRDAETNGLIPSTIHIGTAAHATDSGGRLTMPERSQTGIRVSAPGYVPAELELRPPRRGRHTIVRLRSVRAEVRDLLRRVVAERGGEGVASDWWGRATLDEVRTRVAGSVRRLRRPRPREALLRAELARLLADAAEPGAAPVASFEALTVLVDTVYFGGAGGDEVLTLARQLAQRATEAE